MMLLFGFLSAITALFQSPQVQDNPFVVSQDEGFRYIVKEVNKELPHQVEGKGFGNLIGLDTFEVDIFCNTEDMGKIREQAMRAYKAGQKGLQLCKKTFNFSNHGPTSPSYIRIKVRTPDDEIFRVGIHQGVFYGPSKLPATDWIWRLPETLEFKAIQGALCKYNVTRVDNYTTYIEAEQSAVGYFIVVAMEKVPALEECISHYRAIYKEMKKIAHVNKGNHFLMLEVGFKDCSRYSRTIYNIRNNLLEYEAIPTAGSNETKCGPIYFHPNSLDDLVPKHLHREIYK